MAVYYPGERMFSPDLFAVLDWRHRSLHGHRLATESGTVEIPQPYQRMVPQGGRLVSAVLGLDLFMDGGRLRFAVGDAVIPDTDELVGRLEGLVADALVRAEDIEAQLQEEQRLREEEQRLREEEQRLREELEQEVIALREEVAELRGRQPK